VVRGLGLGGVVVAKYKLEDGRVREGRWEESFYVVEGYV
ncbi:hypothetical protein L195_g028653, partial [Trifolium pratense]